MCHNAVLCYNMYICRWFNNSRHLHYQCHSTLCLMACSPVPRGPVWWPCHLHLRPEQFQETCCPFIPPHLPSFPLITWSSLTQVLCNLDYCYNYYTVHIGNLAVSSHQILPGGISPLPYHDGQGDKSSNSVSLQQYLQASGQLFNQHSAFLLPKQPSSYHHSFTALGPGLDNTNANCNNNNNNNMDTDDTSSDLESMLQYADSYSSDDKQSELSLFDSKKLSNLNPISDQQQVT